MPQKLSYAGEQAVREAPVEFLHIFGGNALKYS
jgi:hypothetical protein